MLQIAEVEDEILRTSVRSYNLQADSESFRDTLHVIMPVLPCQIASGQISLSLAEIKPIYATNIRQVTAKPYGSRY